MWPARHKEIQHHRTMAERLEVAQSCAGELKLFLPLLVDDMENTVAKAYNALPDRLFILDAQAKVAYRGERGPRGFKVDELEAALKKLLAAKPDKTAQDGAD